MRPSSSTLRMPRRGASSARHRLDGDRHVGALLAVQLDELGIVHAIQVVAGEDQDVLRAGTPQLRQLLAHRVGRALVPVHAAGRLFGRQDVDEAAREQVELVGLVDVAVQRGRDKLRQDLDLVDAGVEAVADRDVNQPVFAADRHGRLGPQFGQRVEAVALPSAQDHRHHVLHCHRSPPSGYSATVASRLRQSVGFRRNQRTCPAMCPLRRNPHLQSLGHLFIGHCPSAARTAASASTNPHP